MLTLITKHRNQKDYESYEDDDFYPDHGEWVLRVVGKVEDPSGDAVVVIVVVLVAYRGEIVGEGVEIEVAHRGELIDYFLCAEEKTAVILEGVCGFVGFQIAVDYGFLPWCQDFFFHIIGLFSDFRQLKRRLPYPVAKQTNDIISEESKIGRYGSRL